MIEIKTKVRKWGNSFGIVVPGSFLEKEKVREGEEVKVFIKGGRGTNLSKLFGKHKFRKSTEKLMRETDRELYDE